MGALGPGKCSLFFNLFQVLRMWLGTAASCAVRILIMLASFA